jgi:hypothetical protein
MRAKSLSKVMQKLSFRHKIYEAIVYRFAGLGKTRQAIAAMQVAAWSARLRLN